MKTQYITAPEAKLITGKALATRWNCSQMHLWRMRRDGRLSALMLGKRAIRYRLSDILRIEAESAA
jgi:predicted DNA-binding transcriptional regulator AlpA